MFSSCFYFSIMLLGSLIQKEYQPDKVILSPAMIEEMPYQKVERTIFLSKEDIVSDPDQTLKELCQLQQKSWENLKSVKGRAWKSFVRKKGSAAWKSFVRKKGSAGRKSNGNVIQLHFAASRDPKREKEFIFYLNRMKDAIENTDAKVDFSGVRPDDLESMFCLTAKIRTPKFVVDSTFLSNLTEVRDRIAIEKPDKIFHTSIDVRDYQFRLGMSPDEFFAQKIEGLKQIGMRTVVMRQGDLVELQVWHDKEKKKDQPYWAWLFDLSKNGSCIYFWFSEGSIDAEFVSLDGHWLPSNVRDSRIAQYAEMQFFGWETNSDLSEEFQITSLPATENARIEDRRKGRLIDRKLTFEEYKAQQK